MPIHGSTQMSIHNLEGVLELQDLGFKRVVLARELPLNEIQYICKNSKIEIETFIHGALCISYSGQCLFSSIIGGRSGNRGKCAGPCRLPYELLNHNNVSNKETTMDKGYLLSPKDLCTLDYLPQLIDAGVKCFKIEGRLKTEYYLASVVNAYRNAIDDYMKNPNEYDYNKYLKELEKTKTRGLTTFYFNDRNNKDFQEYDGKQYNPNFEFGGKVLENQANKTLIEIRNKLSIGDKMEILIPGKIEVEEFTIQKMWDSDTEEEITTVNPGKQGQTVKLELPIEAKTGWILRRRK